MTATVRALCLLAALLQACSAGCIRSYGCGQTYPHDASDSDLDLDLDESDSGLEDVYRVPSHTVQVLHYGDPCTCKKSLSYALQKPFPEPPEPTRTYGYDVQAPPAPIPVPLHNYDYRLEVPVEDPEPKTYTYGYEVNAPPSPRPVRLFNYDYKLELPVPEKEPLLKDLYSEVDRVLLPRKDCNVDRRSLPAPLGWSEEAAPPGYYLGDEDPEDDDVLHLGGPYQTSQVPSYVDEPAHEQFHDYGRDYKILRSGGVYRETANVEDEDEDEEEDASEETLELEGIPAGSVVHSAYHSGNQRGHDFRSDLRGPPATIDGVARTRYYKPSTGSEANKYSDVYHEHDDRQIQTETYDENQMGKLESGNDQIEMELLGESLEYPRTLSQKSISHIISCSNNIITGGLYLNSGNIILKAKGESELEEYNWDEFNEQFYPQNEAKRGTFSTEPQFTENDNTYEGNDISNRKYSLHQDDQSLESDQKNWSTLPMSGASEENDHYSGYSSNSQSNAVISNADNEVSKTKEYENQNSQQYGVNDTDTSFKDIKSNSIEEFGDESVRNSRYTEREISDYGDIMTLQEGVAENIFDGIERNAGESSLKQIVTVNGYGNTLTYDNSNGAISHDIPLETNDDFGKWKIYWDEYEPSYSADHLSDPPVGDTDQGRMDLDSSSTQEHLPAKEAFAYIPDAPSEIIVDNVDGKQLQYMAKDSLKEGKEYVIHHDFHILDGNNYNRELKNVNHAKYGYQTD